MKSKGMASVAAAALWLAASAASAQITIGVSVSATGPGASLGVPIRNALEIMPKTIAGQPVKLVILDDASDPAAGAKVLRQLDAADKVDVVIGSSAVPVAASQGTVATEAKLPFIALCPIRLDPPKQPYVFAVPQPVPLMVEGVVAHMRAAGIKSVGFIGFTDAWGDLTFKAMADAAQAAGIKVTGQERYARTDTSVTGQVLKLLATQPEAIFVGGSGTPGALPHVAFADRGFKGPIYNTHGVVNKDFIRVGGKGVDGALAPTGPLVVAEQLPDGHPLKTAGVEFNKKYESTYGAGSRNAFAGYAHDAFVVIAAAVPAALKQAKPGTAEFRQALRDAIAATKDVAGTHAVYSLSTSDHNGVDQRGRVMVKVEGGDWKLVR